MRTFFYRSLFIVFLISSLGVMGSFAQQALTDTPRVVLVQLRAESNRIKALQAAGATLKLSQLKSGQEKVMQAMIADFTDNFKYCPVYFFVDTNYEAVKAKKFAGVLLNGDLMPAANLPISSTSTNYVVVCYGSPAAQSSDDNDKNSFAAKHDNGLPQGLGLVISDYRMREVSFLYKLEFDELFIRRHFEKKYYFDSKQFIMEYYPFASLLSKLLTRNPLSIPVTRIWN
jgi:hypothetical protein